MKITSFLVPVLLLATGCSVISELTAFKKCEFSFRSLQDPRLCGIDMSDKRSFSDFSLWDGQLIATNLIKGSMPFEITVNVEVYNPGPAKAEVSSIRWIAFIDETEAAQGVVNKRVEVAPGGGRALVPIPVQTDLFKFLEGDNPRTMFNFALNLLDAGDQPTRLSMKIRPSVMIGRQVVEYPGYFTITEEFRSGD